MDFTEPPTVDQRHEAKCLCGLMCIINFVNLQPIEQAPHNSASPD